jgi:hypothetical protein
MVHGAWCMVQLHGAWCMVHGIHHLAPQVAANPLVLRLVTGTNYLMGNDPHFTSGLG